MGVTDEGMNNSKAAKETAKEAKKAAAKKAQAKNKSKPLSTSNTVLDTNQQLLIRHMKDVTGYGGLESDAFSTLVNPGIKGTDAKLLSYHGPPEDLVSKMVKPAKGSAFVHATPAQLSILEPLLRFFIVDNKGNEEEVYFSDYALEDRLLKLSSLRRANSGEESMEKVAQRGSSVGIERFAWEYHNKHEGDKIVQASLDLYFGSLSELVNLNYLKFLFTNGLKQVEAPPVGDSTEKTRLDDRLQNLSKEIADKTKLLRPGTSASKTKNVEAAVEKIKDNFRQLKVAVGWAVPAGQRSELLRLFRGGDTTSSADAGTDQNGGKKLENFLSGVKGTQKVLLLNLRTYDIEFNQNGSIKLSIQYVASTDNYLSRDSSDVLGANNFSAGTLNERQIQIRRDLIDTEKVWADGYLGYMLAEELQLNPKGHYVYLQLDRLRYESDVLTAMIHRRELENERESRSGADDQMKLWRSFEKSVGSVYKHLKGNIKSDRYSVFLEKLVETNSVYALSTKFDNTGALVLAKPARAKAKEMSDLKKWLKDAVDDASSKEKKKEGKKDEEKNFKPGVGAVKLGHSGVSTRNILYTRLGDIIKVAMEIAEIRDDANFILGTWYPSQSGVPGYSSKSPDEYEMIYDIPISLEYFGQFFYKNVVLPELDEWPFRKFYTSMLDMVTQVLNRVTNYKLRIQFGWTTFSTYYDIAPPAGILDEYHLNQTQTNINNEPYRSQRPVETYYVLYAKQLSHRNRHGNRTKDEKSGIYHYAIGASRGLAQEFNFKAQDVPQFQAANIEASNAESLSRALILPQDVDIEMIGNSLHRNGDLVYVDSRQALGTFANSILTLGGYYRVVKSTHTITTAGYNTTLGCVFERRTHG